MTPEAVATNPKDAIEFGIAAKDIIQWSIQAVIFYAGFKWTDKRIKGSERRILLSKILEMALLLESKALRFWKRPGSDQAAKDLLEEIILEQKQLVMKIEEIAECDKPQGMKTILIAIRTAVTGGKAEQVTRDAEPPGSMKLKAIEAEFRRLIDIINTIK